MLRVAVRQNPALQRRSQPLAPGNDDSGTVRWELEVCSAPFSPPSAREARSVHTKKCDASSKVAPSSWDSTQRANDGREELAAGGTPARPTRYSNSGW